MSTEQSVNEYDSVTEVVNYVLGLRRNETEYRGQLARISKGKSPFFEHQSIPYIAPRVEHYALTPMLRLAGIMASFRSIPQVKRDDIPENHPWRFGHYCYHVSAARFSARNPREQFSPDPDSPDLIARKIRSFPSIGLEPAAKAIYGILALAAETKIGVNYYDLGRLLLYWDQQNPEKQLAHRSKPVRDYYSETHYRLDR